MKIKRLEMRNFGSYREKTVIDFDKLGDGMYLICGDTGAGKTMIFDAITYALYGRSSGKHRTGGMLRSRSAPPTEEAYVELEFMHKGKAYRIRREYEHIRKALRGSGTAKESASVTLYVPERKDPYIGDGAAKKIDEIIKLTYDQFTKTMMIAQGDFINILNENTKDREPIFSKLFGVDKYTDLTAALRNMHSEEEKNFDAISERVRENYASIAVDEGNELYESFNTLKEQGTAAREPMKELLCKLIAADRKESSQKEAELKELEKKLSASALVLQRIDERKELEKKLGDEKTRYKALLASLEAGRVSLEEAKTRLPEAQALEKDAAKLESELGVYEELDKVRKQADEQKKALETAKADKERRAAQKAAAENELAAWKREHTALADAAVKLEQIQTGIKNAEAERGDMDRLSKRLEELLDLNMQRSTKKKQYEGLKSRAEGLENDIAAAEQEILALEGRVMDRSDLPRQRQQALNDRENTLKSSRELSQLLKDISALESKQAEHKAAALEYKKAESRKEQAKAGAERLEHILRQERAGILALGLIDNEPCPVCGSTSHPRPARLELDEGESIPTDEDIEAAKAELDREAKAADERYEIANGLYAKCMGMKNTILTNAQRLLGTELTDEGSIAALTKDRIAALDSETRALDEHISSLEAEINEGKALAERIAGMKKTLADKREKLTLAGRSLSDAASGLSALDGQIETSGKELDGELIKAFGDSDRAAADARIRERTAKLTHELDEYKNQQQEQQKRLERHVQLGKAIPEKEKQCEELNGRLTVTEGQIAAASSLWSELSARAESLAGGLRFESLEKAKAHLESSRLKAEQLRGAVDRLTETVGKYSRDAAASEGSIKSIEESLSKFEDTDIEKAIQENAQLKEQINQSREYKNKADTRVSMNCAALDRLEKGTQELDEAEKRFMLIKELKETAAGEVKSNKITITSYALGSYFENVLARANERMIIMSDGRYNLIHSGDKFGSSKIGLDIDIIDRDEQTKRNVRTLSGGEGFKALLSLSLGLAEEIQACVGGIEMDSLFVDEGFGTLDIASLDLVMKALGCGSENERSVGMISHVTDIKDQVEHRIEVTNTRTKGSRLTII